MRYIVKNIRDSDKENAKQFELILNNKIATHNEISSIIKERIDGFELNNDILEERLSIESLMQFEKECLFRMPDISLHEMHKFSEDYVNNYLGKDVKIFKIHKTK